MLSQRLTFGDMMTVEAATSWKNGGTRMRIPPSIVFGPNLKSENFFFITRAREFNRVAALL